MSEPNHSQALAASPVPVVSLVDTRERRLVRAALSGDGKAYAELVRPHLPMLLRIAARAGGDASLAEDAVQESLDIAYRRLADLAEDTPMRAFLAGIVVKRAKTLARSERRRAVRQRQAVEGIARVAEPSPQQSMDMRRLIGEVLDELPEKTRRAVILRLDAGMSHAEIAQAIGSTERSVRVLVHRAMGRLREKLQPLMTSEGTRGDERSAR